MECWKARRLEGERAGSYKVSFSLFPDAFRNGWKVERLVGVNQKRVKMFFAMKQEKIQKRKERQGLG